MALTRSAGARKDVTRGTSPIEYRKAAAIKWATTGVTLGSASPLVVGTAGFSYSVGQAGFVASRGISDGVNEYTNDGATTIACPVAPGSGLQRVDIIWTRHPTTGENGDTTSAPIFGVASGTAASANPVAPVIPTGAIELARNTMTSAATSTASAGNLIAQTAAVATLRGVVNSFIGENDSAVTGPLPIANTDYPVGSGVTFTITSARRVRVVARVRIWASAASQVGYVTAGIIAGSTATMAGATILTGRSNALTAPGATSSETGSTAAYEHSVLLTAGTYTTWVVAGSTTGAACSVGTAYLAVYDAGPV